MCIGEPMIFPVLMDDRMLSQTVRWEEIQFSQNIHVMLIELILGLCSMSYLRYCTPSAFICQEASPSWASLVAQLAKSPPATQETWV